MKIQYIIKDQYGIDGWVEKNLNGRTMIAKKSTHRHNMVEININQFRILRRMFEMYDSVQDVPYTMQTIMFTTRMNEQYC